MRIFLVGPMGAGKSSVGKELSNLLGLKFLDSDHLFSAQHSLSINEYYYLNGEEKFRTQESLLLAHITQYNNIILATGGGSILCARTRKCLQQRGLVCYLKVSIQQQMQRLQNDNTRPALPPLNQRYDFFSRMLAQRAPLYEAIADFSIETDNKTIELLAQQLAGLIEYDLQQR